MMNHRKRTMLSTTNKLLASELIDTTIVQNDITAKRQKAKEIYDRQAMPQHAEPEVGTYVYAKPAPQQRGQPWVYGKLIHRDENRSYTIETPKSIIRRNRIHIRPAAAPLTPQCPPVINLLRTSIPPPPTVIAHTPVIIQNTTGTGYTDSHTELPEIQPIEVVTEDVNTNVDIQNPN